MRLRDKPPAGLALVALAAALGLAACRAPDRGPVRVLLMSGQNNHDWRSTTPKLKAILESGGRFQVDVTERPDLLTGPSLEPYDVILSNWNAFGREAGSAAWPEAVRRDYLEFVRQGKGHVVAHAGSSSFPDWEDYARLTLASWKEGRSSHGPRHEFPVRIDDPRHAVTEGLGPFTIGDELWNRPWTAEGAEVLASSFSAPEKEGTGAWEPAVLAGRFGKGRSLTILLGHDVEAMDNPGFQALLRRGVEWAATGRVTAPGAAPAWRWEKAAGGTPPASRPNTRSSPGARPGPSDEERAMSMTKISRRSFLKSAAALAAAPAIVPATVFGRKAPSNRVNLAAIGVGGRGSGNVWQDFVTTQDDVRLVAACDCFAARRTEFAAKVNEFYGGKVCEPMADWREVLARKDVDGVVISTPDHWHVPIAYHAAVAKKDMYVEKPLGVAMAWAWKLRRAAAANKVVFQYGTQQRSSAEFTRAVELVRNGYIGKIKHVDAWCSDMRSPGWYAEVFAEHFKDTEPAPVPDGLDYEMWIGPAPMKPYTKTRCTEWGSYHIYDYALGFIAGWGVHPLDIAQWGLDMDHTSPVYYEGKGEIPRGGLFDTVENWDVRCRYANGVTMRFISDRVAKNAPELMDDPKKRPFMDHGTTFWGEGGWISVSRGALYASPKDLQTARIRDDEKPVIRSSSQGRNFVESMRSRQPTVNPLESAIRSDTISHLSDIAVRLARPVQWDPDKERIIGDGEASKKLDRPMRKPWRM